jgi:hypothetical protein
MSESDTHPQIKNIQMKTGKHTKIDKTIEMERSYRE